MGAGKCYADRGISEAKRKMAQTVAASILVERVPLGALFLACLKVSLLGLGGSLVWARRIGVDQKRWMDDREFADTLTLCQFMPGPNIV
jgi:chromate transport protein ChrA